MSNFPLFIDLKDKEVLVIGGGKVGGRKANTVSNYGAKVTILSEIVKNEDIKDRTDFTFIYKNVNNNDDEIDKLIKDYFLVIAATDNADLNNKIADRCIKINKLVNNVTSKGNMNAMFAAIEKNSEFTVAVSTDGVSCKRAKAMKSVIKKVLNDLEK